MLLAGATAAFVPHAGKIVPRSRHPSHSAPIAAQNVVTPVPLPTPAGWVMVSTEFRLAPSAYDHLINEGLMQLMPELAEELGVTDSFDPRENIMAGSKYLGYLLDVHKGNEALALASYNAGPTMVDRYHGVPPFEETRRYVKSIQDILKRNRAESAD
jgi:Transglycosylase SLT domain